MLSITSAFPVTTETVDRFSGTGLDPMWSQVGATKGTSAYGVDNGRLNFTVSTATPYRTENNINLINSTVFSTIESWSVLIGVHNSAPYASNGASQIQAYVIDPTYNFYLGATLASYRFFPDNNVFGLEKSGASEWYNTGGVTAPATQDVSMKFTYEAQSGSLKVYTTIDGNDPIDNKYSYSILGETTIDWIQYPTLAFGLSQNVYDIAIAQNQMWVDNFAIIPEPSSLSLLALGGVVMAFKKRRKA